VQAVAKVVVVEKVVATVVTVAKVVVAAKAAVGCTHPAVLEAKEAGWAEADSESRCCTPSWRTRLRLDFQRCNQLKSSTPRPANTSSCCTQNIVRSR